jgi:hypothetical protein
MISVEEGDAERAVQGPILGVGADPEGGEQGNKVTGGGRSSGRGCCRTRVDSVRLGGIKPKKNALLEVRAPHKSRLI